MRDISLHLLDILTNSIAAGASRIETYICADHNKDRLTIHIHDNGKGMKPDFLARVTDPFATTRTTRKVGLGLPLMKEACEITGGSLTIESTVDVGTDVLAQFALSSIDRIPLGNTAETFAGLISSYQDRDFLIAFSNDSGEEGSLDTAEVKQTLGDVPLSEPGVYVFIRDYIKEQQEHILGGI